MQVRQNDVSYSLQRDYFNFVSTKYVVTIYTSLSRKDLDLKTIQLSFSKPNMFPKSKVISTSEYDRIHASLNAKQTAEQNRQKKEQENDRLRELRFVTL